MFFRRFNSLVGTSVEYLCVLSTTVISVYEVNTQQQRAANTSVERGSGLSLKYHQKIFGKVNDVAAYRNNRRTDDDLLVLSIDIGKIVILDYDLKNNCFNIVLMCNVEENAIGIGSEFHFDTHGMRRPLGVGIDGRLEVCQENSLLCSVVYGKYLLFIPLDGLRTSHSHEVTDDYDEVINASGTGLRNNSQYINRHFTVDIAQSFKLFGPIIDICFVHGYSQPAMAILQQSGLLPVGHTARVRNTSTVTVLAIDTLLKSSTILWQKEALPSDSISLLKLSSRVFKGAIAVITLNALLVINHREEHGIATNGFAGITVHKRIQLQSWLDIDGGVGLELDASKWIEDSYMAPRSVTNRRVVDGYSSNNDEDYYKCTNSLLGILKDGSLLRIGLSFGVANDMLSSIIFKPEILMNTVRLVTCLSLSTYGQLIFIGSRQVECLLIGVTRKGEEESIDSILESSVKRLHSSSSFLSPTSKKKKRRSLQMLHDSTYGFCELMGLRDDNNDNYNDDNNEDDNDDDNDAQELELHDEDMALYSDVHISLQTMSNNLVNMSSYQLEVVDTIPCIGPILHGIYTSADPIFIQLDHLNWQQPVVINDASSPVFQSASYIPDKEAKDGLIIASGLDDGGSLLRVYQGLRLDKLTLKNLVGSTYIFSIPTLRNSSRSYGVLLIAYEGRTRVLHCQKQEEDEEKGNKSTRNGRGELQMKEMSLSDSGFNLYATTINAGILFEASSLPFVKGEVVCTSKTIVAQITHNGVRVIRLGKGFGQMSEVIQEVSLSESIDKGGLAGRLGERIIAGDVCQGYITLITSMHSLYVLSYDDNDAGRVIIVVKRLDSSLLDDSDRGVNNASTLSDIITMTSTVVSASLYRGILHFQSPSVATIYSHTQKMMDEMKDSDPGKLNDDNDDDDIFIYGKPLSAFANDDLMDTTTTAATVEEVEVEAVTTQEGEFSPMTKQQQQQQQQLYGRQDSYRMEVSDHEEDGDPIVALSQTQQEKTYLIVTDSSNELSIICLHENYDDITCVFQSKEFANLKPFVANHMKNNNNSGNDNNDDGNDDHNNGLRQSRSNNVDSEGIDEDNDSMKVQGLIVETRCANLYELPKVKDNDDDEEEEEKVDSFIHGIFTISFLLHTGDLVVYSAYNINGGPVLGFHRGEVYPNTNKKSGDSKQLFRSHSNDLASTNSTTDPSSPAASNANKKDYRGFLSSSEYLNNNNNNNGPMLSLIDEINGRSAVLVTGNEPLIITTVHGLPSIYSIGLPEIPCINYGLNIVVSFCIKDIKAIASLWIEFEDIQSIKNPIPTTAGAAAIARSNRECLLGIYQQIPSLELYPHSNVSIKRTVVGKTVHKLAEILNRTGDRTQQALLEKKTVVLLCSEECQTPFLPSVLTEAEFEEDGELYERYFTALESFSLPDQSLGRPPYVMERMHSLTLLQLGNIVDTYWLPRNESIVDMEVLYFNLQKSTSIPGMYAPLKTLEQRVYVAACTTVIDKRGEDTQGKGRLLLFGIDYALFEADEEEDEDVAATRDTSGTAVATVTNASVKGSSGNESSSIETKGGDKGDKRSSISMAQAKFLGSIKPKLRLLWSGTGPASIIKQLGEYVLTTVGSIVYVYKFNPDTTELEQVAFYYAQIYITSVSIVKNYIILADMFHSIQLLYWRAEDYSLNFVSKDYDRSVVPASGFVIDGNKLAIVAADDESNIQLFQENPRYIVQLHYFSGIVLMISASLHGD